MALPRYKSFLGIAKEVARNAGVSPTAVIATDFIPISNSTPMDNIRYLDDKNWRGSMVDTYGTVQGVVSSEIEFGGDVFPDTIGYAAAGLLGDYAITGASAPFTHTISTKNSGTGQATSYSITDFNAFNARQYTGCQFGSLDLKFNADGLLEYTAKAEGFQSGGSLAVVSSVGAAGTVTYTVASSLGFYVGNSISITGSTVVTGATLNLTAQIVTAVTTTTIAVSNVAIGTGTGGTIQVVTPTNTYSTVLNVPSWTGVTTIAGATSLKLAEGNIAITRPLTPIYTVDGSQNPYQIFQGPVSVNGSLKLIYEDDTDLVRYLTNTQPSFNVTFSQGTGGTATSISVTMTKCAFKVAKIDRGKDFVELDVTYEAIANTTDVGASSGFSPVKIVLQNAKSTAVYA